MFSNKYLFANILNIKIINKIIEFKNCLLINNIYK